MTRYTVDFSVVASVTVDVDADDPEEAIEKAYDLAPTDICAQCSGWRQPWSLNLDGELEPESVLIANAVVWKSDTRWTREGVTSE